MADTVIRVRVDDAGASTGLNRLGDALDRLEHHSASGTQGLRRVEFGLRELAGQATGLTGGFGKLAEGMLLFGAGSTVMLGVTAGLAVIGGSMAVLKDLTAGVTEEWSKLNKELATTAGGPVAQLAVHLGEVRDRLEELKEPGFKESLFEALGRNFDPSFLNLADAARQKRQADVTTAGAIVGQIQNQQTAAQLGRNIAQANAEIGLGPNIPDLTHIRLPQIEVGTTKPGAFLAGAVEDFLKQLPSPALLQAQALAEQGTATPADAFAQLMAARAGIPWGMLDDQSKSLFRRYGQEVVEHLNATGQQQKAITGGARATIIAQALSSLVVGAQAGGAGGVLGGLGGALGALSQFGGGLSVLGPIGAVVGVLGGIASLFGRHRDAQPVMIMGYSETALTQEEKLLLATLGVKGVNVGIIGTRGQTDAVIGDLARRSRLGGEMRLPPGMSHG